MIKLKADETLKMDKLSKKDERSIDNKDFNQTHRVTLYDRSKIQYKASP